jgi:hypothetical protein
MERLVATVLCVLAWPCLVGFGPWRAAGLGTAALGAGDAVVAAGAGGAALHGNPAAMAQVKQYTLEGSFLRDPAGGATALSGSAVDATSQSGIAGGVGYTSIYDWTLDQPKRTGSDLRGGLALGLDSEAGRLLFGATARYLDLATTTAGKARTLTGWTGDLGAAVAVGLFRFGVAWRNVLELDATEAPGRIATGVAMVDPRWLLEADGSWGLDAGSGQTYRVGGALQFADEGPGLRLGYTLDETVASAGTRHWVTGGLAWRTTRIGLELGCAYDTTRGDLVLGASLLLQVPSEL